MAYLAPVVRETVIRSTGTNRRPSTRPTI